MFGFTEPPDEDRREPVFGAVTTDMGSRREPLISLVTLAEASVHGWVDPGLRRDDTKAETWWVRLRGPVGSLLLHLLPLLLLINWQMSPPAEIEPVTV